MEKGTGRESGRERERLSESEREEMKTLLCIWIWTRMTFSERGQVKPN